MEQFNEIDLQTHHSNFKILIIKAKIRIKLGKWIYMEFLNNEMFTGYEKHQWLSLTYPIRLQIVLGFTFRGIKFKHNKIG